MWSRWPHLGSLWDRLQLKQVARVIWRKATSLPRPDRSIAIHQVAPVCTAIHGFLSQRTCATPAPPLKWHLDQFSRFRARRYAHTQSQRQATARATCVAIGRIYAMNHRRTRRELLQLEQAAAVTTAKGRIDAAAYWMRSKISTSAHASLPSQDGISIGSAGCAQSSPVAVPRWGRSGGGSTGPSTSWLAPPQSWLGPQI